MVADYNRLFEEFPSALLLLDPSHTVFRSNLLARSLFGEQAQPGTRFPQKFPAGQHRLPSPEAGGAGLVVDVRPYPAEKQGWLYVFREDPEVTWTSEDTERLAFEDPLTGLPNWNILSQFIDHSCSQSQRYQRSSALLRLDIDHLRQVNLELGRASGDEVLVQAAQRLQNNVRSSDIVGRLEGDQFMVLLTELTNDRGGAQGADGTILPVRQRAAVVAERLNKAFRQPFEVHESQINCTLSIGVAVCPEDARSPQDWREAAELALTHCKASAGDDYVLYAEALKHQHQQKLERFRKLEEGLRQGLISFDWLEVEGPSAMQHYWWKGQELSGFELRDALDSGGLYPAWGKWQKAHLHQLERREHLQRYVPLPPVWLNPGFDNAWMLDPGWMWEVDESTLQHRTRLQVLLQLQERGLNWALACSSRGLQNLSLLGKLQPKILKLPLPARLHLEQKRLLRTSSQVARSLGIEVMVARDSAESLDFQAELSPQRSVQLPG